MFEKYWIFDIYRISNDWLCQISNDWLQWWSTLDNSGKRAIDCPELVFEALFE